MGVIANKIFNNCYCGVAAVGTQISRGVACGAQKIAQFMERNPNITTVMLGSVVAGSVFFVHEMDLATSALSGLVIGLGYKNSALRAQSERDIRNLKQKSLKITQSSIKELDEVSKGALEKFELKNRQLWQMMEQLHQRGLQLLGWAQQVQQESRQLRQGNQQVQQVIGQLQQGNQQLQQKNYELQETIRENVQFLLRFLQLYDMNPQLEETNRQLQQANQELGMRNHQLGTTNSQLQQANQELGTRNHQLVTTNSQLLQLLETLEEDDSDEEVWGNEITNSSESVHEEKQSSPYDAYDRASV